MCWRCSKCVPSLLLRAVMPLQLSGVWKAESTVATGVWSLSCVDLHMKLYVSLLSEPHATNFTLVGLLSCVDPCVSEVVCVDPEGLVALLTFIGFLSWMLKFVGFQSLMDYKPLPTKVTDKGPLPWVDPSMVVICSFVEKRPAACLTLVLHLACVNELVSLQWTCTLEALVARLTAERRHVHCCLVQPIDNSALMSLSSSSGEDPSVSFNVTHSLVFL